MRVRIVVTLFATLMTFGCGGEFVQDSDTQPGEVLDQHLDAMRSGDFPAWLKYYDGRVPSSLLSDDTGGKEAGDVLAEASKGMFLECLGPHLYDFGFAERGQNIVDHVSEDTDRVGYYCTCFCNSPIESQFWISLNRSSRGWTVFSANLLNHLDIYD